MMDVLNDAVGSNDNVKYMKLLDKKFPVIYCNQNHRVSRESETAVQAETRSESTPSDTAGTSQTKPLSTNVDTHSNSEMEGSKTEEVLVAVDGNSPTASNTIVENAQTVTDQIITQERNGTYQISEGGMDNSAELTSVEQTDHQQISDDPVLDDLLGSEINDILEMALAVEEETNDSKPKFKYEADVMQVNEPFETDLKSESGNNDERKQLDSTPNISENLNVGNNVTTSKLSEENPSPQNDNSPDEGVDTSTASPICTGEMQESMAVEPRLLSEEHQPTSITTENAVTSASTEEPSSITQGNKVLSPPTSLPSEEASQGSSSCVAFVDPVGPITNNEANSIHQTQNIETCDSHSAEPINEVEDQMAIPNEFLDDAPINSLSSISGKLNILDYAQSEWKGTTFKANCMRKGYQKLIQATGCRLMRQVRGDNYCALRATAYQVLSQNIGILKSHPNRDEFLTDLPNRLLTKYECSWVKEWSFADRIPSTFEQRITVMENCMSFLAEQLNISDGIDNTDDRQSHFSALFNSGSLAEIKLFEALKLLMLEKAIELHTLNSKGVDVPVFAWLLFARDTSEEPKTFMLNHLNLAGKSGGLEQVEMFLLGQSIEVTIRVIRPSSVDQEDFITFYPDSMVEEWQKITLIAEDDRHYNIVMN